MKGITIIPIVSAGALLAFAAALVLSLDGCSHQQGGAGFSMPPMPVEVAQARLQKVEDTFDAVGTIEATESVTIVSEIDGAVTAIPFQEGGYIEKGALIAQIDDSQLAAEVERAEALRDQSRTSYERTKDIVAQNAGAPQDLDDAAAALKVAGANLALAKARFAKTRITAPFSGIIGARNVSLGTFVRSGMAITELANIDEIRVNFSAPERFLSDLHQGAAVAVSTIAYPGYRLNGRIIAVEPVLDPGTRSVRVVAGLSNPGRKFRPGMSASISAILKERPNAVTVPSEAVFANGNQNFVFIVKSDSTVARIPVSLGTRTAEYVEIVSGLTPGAEVIRAGHQKLMDGARVLAIPALSVKQN